jgi:hypothetical protein
MLGVRHDNFGHFMAKTHTGASRLPSMPGVTAATTRAEL